MSDNKAFWILFKLLTLAIFCTGISPVQAQQPSVRISIENFQADTGAVWFDVYLEQGSLDEGFLGNAQIVFTMDTSWFNWGGNPADSIRLIKTGYADLKDYNGDPLTSPFMLAWGKRSNATRLNLFTNANQVNSTGDLHTLTTYLGPGAHNVGRVVIQGFQGGTTDISLAFAERTGTEFNLLVTDLFSFNPSNFDQDRMLVEYGPIPRLGSAKVDFHAFLEGAYDQGSGEMLTTLNDLNYVPLAQPYQTAPWNYAGAEAVTTLPDSVVDWVLVEVRIAPNAATAATNGGTSLGYRAGFISRHGHLLDTNFTHGIYYDDFVVESGDSVYIVIHHRNHLAVMTGHGAEMQHGAYFADMRSSEGEAYLGENKEIAPGVYGLAAGDLNQDGRIQAQDRAYLGGLFTPASGYYREDLNMDGEKDALDHQFLMDDWAYVISFELL